MWFIIPCLVTVALWALIRFLIHCDWSPVVRRRYINIGWDDGMRWDQPPYLPPHLNPYLITDNDRALAMRLYNRPYTTAQPTTELDMSPRRFDYYMTGYEQALDYKREREGIIATRRSELDRVRRLDHEIRKAHHELTEEA